MLNGVGFRALSPSTGSTAMRIAARRVLDEDRRNRDENRAGAGSREFGELTRAEVCAWTRSVCLSVCAPPTPHSFPQVQRLARRHAAEEVSRVEHGARTSQVSSHGSRNTPRPTPNLLRESAGV